MRNATLKTVLTWALFILLCAGGLSGCYQLGKAAGTIEKGIENSADQFDKGYEDGKKS
jgi:hypothetical protein